MNESPNPWLTLALFCLASWMFGFVATDTIVYFTDRPMMEVQE
jgi:hypothetical protein